MSVLHLLGPEEVWDTFNRRMEFLDRFAVRAPDLIRSRPGVAKDMGHVDGDEQLPDGEDDTGLAGPDHHQGQLAAVAALTDASGLAFAAGDIHVGLYFADKVIDKLASFEGQLSAARFASLGAVTGRCQTTLIPNGIMFKYGSSEWLAPWQAPITVLDQISTTLVGAAVASGSPKETLPLLLAADVPSTELSLLKTAFLNSPLADALPLFGASRDKRTGYFQFSGASSVEHSAGLAALAALHQSAARRLRTLRADSERWRNLRVQVPLLDWPLLTFHIGLVRNKIDLDPQWMSGLGSISEFLEFYVRLADEIVLFRPVSKPPHRAGPSRNGGTRPGRRRR